jgi:hypothetical protein
MLSIASKGVSYFGGSKSSAVLIGFSNKNFIAFFSILFKPTFKPTFFFSILYKASLLKGIKQRK